MENVDSTLMTIGDGVNDEVKVQELQIHWMGMGMAILVIRLWRILLSKHEMRQKKK